MFPDVGEKTVISIVLQILKTIRWSEMPSAGWFSHFFTTIPPPTGYHSVRTFIDFLKVVRMVFWSGVVGPGTSFRSLALRARRSYDRASRSLSRYALKSSTCEQVYI